MGLTSQRQPRQQQQWEPPASGCQRHVDGLDRFALVPDRLGARTEDAEQITKLSMGGGERSQQQRLETWSLQSCDTGASSGVTGQHPARLIRGNCSVPQSYRSRTLSDPYQGDLYLWERNMLRHEPRAQTAHLISPA